jgi:hypothetical protein
LRRESDFGVKGARPRVVQDHVQPGVLADRFQLVEEADGSGSGDAACAELSPAMTELEGV